MATRIYYINRRFSCSSESAASFRMTYKGDPTKREPKTSPGNLLLRELLLEQVVRQPRTAAELRARLVESYGSFHVRAFWRALAHLVSTKKIERIGQKFYSDSAYRRPRIGRAP